jgi:hypothetical protein
MLPSIPFAFALLHALKAGAATAAAVARAVLFKKSLLFILSFILVGLSKFR